MYFNIRKETKEIYISNTRYLLVDDDHDEIFLLSNFNQEENEIYKVTKLSLGKLLKTGSKEMEEFDLGERIEGF